MGVFHNLFGNRYIFVQRFGRRIDHHGGESAVDAVPAKLVAVTVIQVQADGQAGLYNGRFNQLYKISVISICSRAF